MDLNPFSAIRTSYPTSSPKWVKYSRLAYCWQNNPPPPRPPQKKREREKKKKKKRKKKKEKKTDCCRLSAEETYIFAPTVHHRWIKQFSSVRFKMVSMHSEKPILCAPSRLSVVSSIVAFDKIPVHDGAFSVLL